MTRFTMTRAWLALALVAGSLGVGAQPAQRGGNPGVAPPQSNPHGMSYAEWGAAWWQWAISFPLDESPVTDTTGDLADLGQSGPVWFLAGTFGGSAERTVTIPAGKALFFPIVNFIGVFIPEPGEPEPSEEEFREIMDFIIASGFSLECTVDGVALEDLEDYRAQTDVFGVTVPEGGLVDAGTFDFAMADGFWLMLSPLSAGEHTIHIAGSLDLFGLEVDVTYNLTVGGGN